MATRAVRSRLRVSVALLAGAGLFALALPVGATTKSERAVKVERVAKYGEVLFSAKGFALYTYAHDTKNHSTCDASCLSAWPALEVASGVRPTGVTGLGVIVRAGGAHQVTWHGRPLYIFASDSRRGEVTGDGVGGFHVARLSSGTTTTTTTHSYGY
jgi:predicted lipoprotein with Yx(FWY)xxD motif